MAPGPVPEASPRRAKLAAGHVLTAAELKGLKAAAAAEAEKEVPPSEWELAATDDDEMVEAMKEQIELEKEWEFVGDDRCFSPGFRSA